MATQSIRFEQFFSAPREAVFAWFAQHDNVGRLFCCHSQRVHDSAVGTDPNGVGSVRRVQHGLIRLEQTVTRFEPPSLIEYRGAPGWAVGAQIGRVRFESVPGGTLLEYSIEFNSRLPLSGGLLTGLLTRAWRHGVQVAVEAISTTAPS